MKKKLYSFLLAAFLATTSMFAADITTGLKMHYTFESIDTVDGVTVFTDQSLNNNHGVILDTITLGEGFGTGKAVNLVDTLKGIVKAPNGILTDVTDFTVSFWINQNDYSTWGRVFDFGNNTTQYMFLTCIDKKFRFAIKYNDAMGEDLLNASFIMPTKQWLHVAVTGDFTVDPGVDTSSVVNLYIDGMLAGTSTEFDVAPYMLGNTTYNVIGDSQWADPSINARLDDFRFYNRALSTEDLLAIHGFTAELIDAYNGLVLDPESLIEIMPESFLTLPAVSGTLPVVWTTSDSTVIKADGTPIHSELEIRDAVLTGTVSLPNGLSLSKDFAVSVYPTQPPIEMIAQWNFLSDKITTRNDTTFIGDEGEVVGGFEAYTVGGARVFPIGTGSTEGTDLFNVVAFGNTGNQWLELGKPIGEYIYKLRDYTVSVFVRKDTTVDHKTWSDYGQLLYAFGNSEDLGGKAYGGMYFEPKRARHVCTPSNYGNEPFVGVGENKTPLGNTWHNVTYAQVNGVGTLYFDAVQVATGTMPQPRVALRTAKDVQTYTGTLYNRLGGRLYSGDTRAKNTLMYGFSLYSIGFTSDDLEGILDITNKIQQLNDAQAVTTFDINAYLAAIPLMATARTTLTTGFQPAAADLQAALDVCKQDSIDKTPTAEHVATLTEAIATYNELCADWVAIGKTLKTFDDEIALGFPGLEVFQAAIATAQSAYTSYTVDAETIATLDAAVLTYYQSQTYSASRPADYNWVLTNPGFETGVTGGTKLAGFTTGSWSALNMPKGWGSLVVTDAWTGCNYYSTTPSEGGKCYEVWSGGKVSEVDLSQITSQPLQAGYYILSGDVRTTDSSKAGTQHVYAITAENKRFTSDSLEKTWPGGHGWTNTGWKKVFCVFNTTGGVATVGFRSNNIVQYDNMKLSYFGTEAPTVGDVTSYVKNPGFEAGARAEELEGFDANTSVKAELGNFFAPADWSVVANVDTTENQSDLNIITTNPTEGSKAYQMFADTVKNVKLYQTLYAPSTGVYMLTADVRSDSSYKSDARLFVKVLNRYEEGQRLYLQDTLKNSNVWKNLKLEFRANASDAIQLGLLSSGNVQVDNFKLELINNAPTAISGEKANSSKYQVYSRDGIIHISGLTNERVSVYDIAGRQISVKNASQIKVSKGLYLVKINNDVVKQLVK